MWRMSKIQIFIWAFIAIFSLVLLFIRTRQFGWFEGKDPVLWIVFGYALYRSVIGFRTKMATRN